ncbi:MAG TPA: hypothetical protein VK843_02985 [Planctomycetota bacterium]|nr:hypothetical protein [Planctomycetota bacterium]
MRVAGSRRIWIAAAIVAACGLCFAPLPDARDGARSTSLAVRLLGPIASLAASAQWVRADLALQHGRVELFLVRARTALQLAPEDVEGWKYLARHQAMTLGSPEREPDPQRRLAWIRAGLATAAEGEGVASNPGELAYTAGLIMLKVARLDAALPWPGGLPAVWEEAASHFERAGKLGLDAETAAFLTESARRTAEFERAGH